MEVPKFSTSRLQLRKIYSSDQEIIFKGLSHPAIIKYYGVSYSTLEETKEQMTWYENLEKSKSGFWWAIRMKENNQFCGAIGYNDYHKEHKKAEIGFWLFPKYWGMGIIQEAAQPVIEYLFQKLHLHRIEAFVERDNTNSEKLLKKLNFHHEGTMRECEIKDGNYIDIHLYALLHK